MKTSLLGFILENKKNLDKCWEQKLIDIDVFEEVEPLYKLFDLAKTKKSIYYSNLILSFIVLAYDNNSEFISIHKDRLENKEQIMEKLAGVSWKTHNILADTVYTHDNEINKVIDWYLSYQKDWRWKTIITCFEYHSEVMNMKPSTNAKTTLEVGKCIEEAIKRRREGEKMLEEIRKEFVNIDTVLEKENRPKLTDKIDFMSHEAYILRKENGR